MPEEKQKTETATDGAAEEDAKRKRPLLKLPTARQINGITLYGVRVQNILLPVDIKPADHINNLRNMTIRDDDILIWAYMKSGTHWLWEKLTMLTRQTIQYENRTKGFSMIERMMPGELQSEPSPRVLNTHLWTAHLPQEIFSKKIKIIVPVRNPKDVVVSLYHHYQALPGADFTFQDLIDAIIQDDQMHCPNQFKFYRHVSEYMAAHPDHKILFVYYENMKKDPIGTTKTIARFLELPVTDQFCEDVARACDFENLKKADENKHMPAHLANRGERISIFRKGVVADWKNYFTVAQNDQFQAFIEDERRKGGLDNFHFIYENKN